MEYLPIDHSLRPWGPSEQEIQSIRKALATEAVDWVVQDDYDIDMESDEEGSVNEGGDSDFSDVVEEDMDIGLIERLDALDVIENGDSDVEIDENVD